MTRTGVRSASARAPGSGAFLPRNLNLIAHQSPHAVQVSGQLVGSARFVGEHIIAADRRSREAASQGIASRCWGTRRILTRSCLPRSRLGRSSLARGALIWRGLVWRSGCGFARCILVRRGARCAWIFRSLCRLRSAWCCLGAGLRLIGSRSRRCAARGRALGYNPDRREQQRGKQRRSGFHDCLTPPSGFHLKTKL